LTRKSENRKLLFNYFESYLKKTCKVEWHKSTCL
jgi:hypothetical protein